MKCDNCGREIDSGPLCPQCQDDTTEILTGSRFKTLNTVKVIPYEYDKEYEQQFETTAPTHYQITVPQSRGMLPLTFFLTAAETKLLFEALQKHM